MTDLKTPELDKLRAVAERSQTCGEFVEWLLDEKGLTLAEWCAYADGEYEDERLMPCHPDLTKLLAEFFGIDLGKVEEERSALIDEMRAQTKGGADV